MWFHRTCSGLAISTFKRLKPGEWACPCKNWSKEEINLPELSRAKFFCRYVDDILRTIKHSEIEPLFETANSLHPNLQFTIEHEEEGAISFLDLKVMRSGRKLNTSWYRKATDTGVIMNYHSCAPSQYKRNIVEGTVHRIDHTTSDWVKFRDELEGYKAELENNQYPPAFYEKCIANTLSKIVDGSSITSASSKVREMGDQRDTRALLLINYRGVISDNFARRIRKLADIKTIFTTRKLKTCLPSLKDAVPKELKSRVVYEICCSGCNARYVGQTVRHFQTRLGEHLKDTAPVGIHMKGCGAGYSTKILEQSNDPVKLLTLEALHIAQRKPQINGKQEEYRKRHLTVKL